MATIAEYMSAAVEPVRADTPLVAVAQQMRRAGIGALPVVDAEGSCVGIVSERDMVVRVVAEERDPRAAVARDVATPGPITCELGERAPAVVARMRRNEVQHLPVLDGGRVVGLVSLADVVFRRPDQSRGVGLPLDG